jgi:hypothetical protein
MLRSLSVQTETINERRYPPEIGGGPSDPGSDQPAGTIAVAATNWPDSVKTIVGSILVLGFEIMLIPAVALMGKDNYERIRDKAIGLLKTLKPAGNVSSTRYKVGLYMLVCPTLYA